MNNEGLIYDGVKAFSLRALSDRGWTIEGESESDIMQLVSDAAWLWAVIQKRAGAVVSIPRVLMKGSAEVEEDSLPFEFDIPDLMGRSSFAVDTYAKAYGLTVKNQFKDLRVRWFMPDSVTPIIDEQLGLQRFERQAGTKKYIYDYDSEKDLSPDGLWWIWQTGMPEIGPGTPKADVAAAPAMLLRAIDSLGIKYFSQGAIGQIYFTSPKVMGDSQFDKFKKWFRRRFQGGLDTAYNEAMVLEEGFEPHKLSADPKELMMSELDEDNRRDISAIYDTPEALVTGDAGSLSRATLDRITSNWINGTIMQQATLIVDAFNHHILEPAGYKLKLDPQAMTVNQEEERQRAQAVTFLVGAGFNPEWVAGMLGLEGPEDIPMMAEKQPVPEALQPTFGPEEDADELEPKDDEEPEEKAVELGRLRRYIGKGKHLKRSFQSDILTPMEIDMAIWKSQFQGVKYVYDDATDTIHVEGLGDKFDLNAEETMEEFVRLLVSQKTPMIGASIGEVGKAEDAPFWKSYP